MGQCCGQFGIGIFLSKNINIALGKKMKETHLALEAYNDGINIAKKMPDFHALSELNSAKLNLEMEM